MSLGVNPSAFGPPLAEPVRITWPEPELYAGRIQGEVVYIDRFGNLITNIDEPCLEHLSGHGLLHVEIAGRICPLGRTYSDVPPGQLVGLIGSSGHLEVSVNTGSAALELGVRVREPVRVF